MSMDDGKKNGRKASKATTQKTSSANASASPSAAGTRKKVTELARHIDELGREVDHLKRAARREVEQHWAVHHSDLYPRFLRWKEALGIESFSVFSIEGDELQPEPLLSSPSAPRHDAPIHVRRGTAALQTWWGGSVGDLVAFALASRDCQVDFRAGVLCVPIVFFDNPRGLVIARVKAVSAKSYGTIMAETATLLTHVRETAQNGQAGASKTSTSAAS